MESNEQTEPAIKIETDSQLESRLIALGDGVGIEGIEGSNKKEKELMDMDSGAVIAGGREWVEAEGDIRRINSNGKIAIKINIKNQD